MAKFAKRKCKCADVTPETCIGDDEVLSQFGFQGKPFKNEPDEAGDLSMVRGAHSPLETYRRALGHEPPSPDTLTVRSLTAGTVRRAGFVVVHTPGRLKKNDHVSIVQSSEESVCNPEVPWEPGVVSRLEACFNDAEGSDPSA